MTAIIGGLIAAACFSTTLLTSARASRMIGVLPTLGGVMLVSGLVALPVAALTIDGSPPTADVLPYLVIAGVGNVAGLGFEYVGFRSGKIGIVGALAAAEGAIAAILSLVAGELLGSIQFVGVLIVALGVILVALGPDPTAGAGRHRRDERSSSARWPVLPSAPASIRRVGSARSSRSVGRSCRRGSSGCCSSSCRSWRRSACGSRGRPGRTWPYRVLARWAASWRSPGERGRASR